MKGVIQQIHEKQKALQALDQDALCHCIFCGWRGALSKASFCIVGGELSCPECARHDLLVSADEYDSWSQGEGKCEVQLSSCHTNS